MNKSARNYTTKELLICLAIAGGLAILVTPVITSAIQGGSDTSVDTDCGLDDDCPPVFQPAQDDPVLEQEAPEATIASTPTMTEETSTSAPPDVSTTTISPSIVQSEPSGPPGMECDENGCSSSKTCDEHDNCTVNGIPVDD